MESVICCCKYYRTNVLRIVLRHLQIRLICRSSHDLDDSEKFGNRINQFYLCTQAYSVVLPIRSAPTLHNKIHFHAGILRKLQIERLVLEKLNTKAYSLSQSNKNCPTFEVFYFTSVATEVNTSLIKAKHSLHRRQQNRPICL